MRHLAMGDVHELKFVDSRTHSEKYRIAKRQAAAGRSKLTELS